MEEKLEFIADHKDSNTRLDIFLARSASITRSQAGRLIGAEQVRVDGQVRKAAFRILPGMKIDATLPGLNQESSNLNPWVVSIDVIYEDEWIIVINKPAGLVVHPGAGNRDKTLVNALIVRYPDIGGVGSSQRPGIVHRLDKLTSGVMVVARNEQAYQVLSKAFSQHSHTRIYTAVCYGHMTDKQGSIETLMHRHPADRKKMSTKVTRGRHAVTHWEVRKEWRGFSLLRLQLETGRTHQIRVHLSDRGNPVVGDPVYGGQKRWKTIMDPVMGAYIKNVKRQMLHAEKLGFFHPGTCEWMEFVSPLPQDMQDLIELIDKRSN